jgi:hypothetical protein
MVQPTSAAAAAVTWFISHEQMCLWKLDGWNLYVSGKKHIPTIEFDFYLFESNPILIRNGDAGGTRWALLTGSQPIQLQRIFVFNYAEFGGSIRIGIPLGSCWKWGVEVDWTSPQ